MLKRKTVVMSFDKPFIKYASIAIHRLLTLNPDWDINCLAVNVSTLDYYPFNSDRVKIKYRSLIIDSSEELQGKNRYFNPIACYMNSSRFYFVDEIKKNYDLIVMMDADTVSIKPLEEIEREMEGKDVGIIEMTNKGEDFERFSAAFVAFNTGNREGVDAWLKIWAQEFKALTTYFFNDQLAMFHAISILPLEYRVLDKKKYCSFIKRSETIVLTTAGAVKETRSQDYNEECIIAEKEIKEMKENVK